MKKALNAVGLVLALTGCANTATMRSLATQTSTSVTNQEAQMNDFISAQRQQNADNAGTLKTTFSEAASQQQNTAQILLAWKLAAAKDVIGAQALAAQVQPADIVASLTISDPPASKLDDGGAGASLDKANSSFTAMAKKPGASGVVKELYASGNAVYSALQAQQSKQKPPAAVPAAVASATPNANLADAKK